MLHVHVCCKPMFRVFSGVSYICLQVFHLDVAYVCNGFQLFSDIFASVSDACLKCFNCLLLYAATVASGHFKSRSGVAHRMRVGDGRRRGRRPGVAWDHYWCAPSLCGQRLAPGSDIRVLASPKIHPTEYQDRRHC